MTGGPLNLVTEPGGFRIKGQAQLAGHATMLDWHQFFESKGNPYSMQVKASVGADSDLRHHFGIDLDDYIKGTMPVDVVYTEKGDGSAAIDGKGDLGPVALTIRPFGYIKDAGMPGTLSLNGVLKNKTLTELDNVNVTAKNLSVKGARLGFGPRGNVKTDLLSGELSNVTVGQSRLDVKFDTDKDDVMNIVAKGPVFDLGAVPARQRSDAKNLTNVAKQRKMAITLSAEKMLVKNDQSVL